ncbi:hypothetical protein E4U17_006135 [Claviceps sp. LM77 group G4]|nr:hypothetical protein E4U17_006135 [Claviceps sp. LM77 group G4]KAG6082119.1 hypothetical protein E4U33_006024 [Claviceps sp. LM78 group G4]KAG6083013.1 hypothetical protein E4U16_005033 [Claviceps sp. LM84 group G4]
MSSHGPAERQIISFPIRYQPPDESLTPNQVFPAAINQLATEGMLIRFINHRDPHQMLIYTHGTSLSTIRTGTRAGFAFVFEPSADGCVASAVEGNELIRISVDLTSIRPELSAAISALRHRQWDQEGFTTIVLATNSDHLARGATHFAPRWVRADWMSESEPINNQDLWKALLEEVGRYNSLGLTVRIWNIQRRDNQAAYKAANRAARIPLKA